MRNSDMIIKGLEREQKNLEASSDHARYMMDREMEAKGQLSDMQVGDEVKCGNGPFAEMVTITSVNRDDDGSIRSIVDIEGRVLPISFLSL
jgi:predicted transcriptional regulator